MWLLSASAVLLLAGCSGARAPMSAHGYAPALDDSPLQRSGGTNPNAPFAVLEPAHALARRPALIDPTLAEPCNGAQLSAYESGASVNGEQRQVRVSLVNHASTACKLSGIPSVSLMASDGTPMAQVVVEHGAGVAEVAAGSAEPDAVVVLPARGESEFTITWTTGASCPQVASIAVAAPGTTRSYLVPHPLAVCGDRITVSAVEGPRTL
jgi:hypothetical protein